MAVDGSQRVSFTGAAITEGTFIGQAVITNGAANGTLLQDIIKTASPNKYPIAIDLIVYPTVGEPSRVVELRTAPATVGFPLPHVPSGAGSSHPSPLRLNLSQTRTLFLCENAGGADNANVAFIGYF